MAAQRAFLIDASIYIFRAWFSLPDQWHTRDGWPLNAVYGYTRFLLEFLEQQQPIHCALAFDKSLGSCFRNEIYCDYKASRELPDEALAFQLKTCREVTETLGLPCYGGERYEADDYLALVGDPVDDIPGVPGVGAKTAAALLEAFEISRSLTGLEEAVPGLDDIPQYTLQAGQVQALASHLEQINLQGPLTRRCENLARSLAP